MLKEFRLRTNAKIQLIWSCTHGSINKQIHDKVFLQTLEIIHLVDVFIKSEFSSQYLLNPVLDPTLRYWNTFCTLSPFPLRSVLMTSFNRRFSLQNSPYLRPYFSRHLLVLHVRTNSSSSTQSPIIFGEEFKL